MRHGLEPARRPGWGLGAGVATFEAGRMTHWEDFGDRRLALEAVGLSE